MASIRSGYDNNSTAATLWAHLSRKETLGRTTASSETGTFLPPSGPQDKTTTTMRVLLHDTQMNLEKFCGSVEQLIQDVHATNQTIQHTGSLYEQEHDKLMGDIIDLVNRAQTKILASMGTPVQAQVVEGLFKDVDQRLESIDQRLDAIHAFNQTHSQALQTQMNTIQSLQTQQNVIIAAVAPLLPLLQTVTSSFSSMRTTVTRSPSAPELLASKPSPKPSRSVISISSDDSRRSARKRGRSSSAGPITSSPLANGYARKIPRIDSSNGANSVIASPPAEQSGTPERKPALRTPRRPLQEIVFRSPRLSFTPNEPQRLRPIPPTIQRPGHSKVSPKAGVSGNAPESRLDKIVRQMSVQRNSPKPSNVPGTVPLNTPSRPNIFTSQRSHLRTENDVRGNGSSVSKPTPKSLRTETLPTNAATPALPQKNRNLAPVASHRRLFNVPVPLPAIERMPAPSFVPTRNKEPAPLKEGKRFIPLVDTDEEDEDE